MCGFAALLGDTEISSRKDKMELCLSVMAKRGPDASQIKILKGALLGHVRLSIIDLDARAHQPFFSNNNRFVIVYNGEIYNYVELREKLLALGYTFRTDSDTEVLLALYMEYGDKCLLMLRGMFAFVIWDTLNHEAFVARDPFGIKPLYYSVLDQGVVLASQYKAIHKTNFLEWTLDSSAINYFHKFGNFCEPTTPSREIRSLPGGFSMRICNNNIIEIQKWIDTNAIIGTVKKTKAKRSNKSTTELLCNEIEQSVSSHLKSDVPMGILLSGGVDSISIAALASRHSARLKGITLSFSDVNSQYEYEENIARDVARYLGIEHKVYNIDKTDFLNDLEQIFDDMDVPSVDGINTWYACKAAKESGLKVVFSGVGGDEIFQGYSSFPYMRRIKMFTFNFANYWLTSCVMNNLLALISVFKKNDKWNRKSEVGNSRIAAYLFYRALKHISLKRLFPQEHDEIKSNKAWHILSENDLHNDINLATSQLETHFYLKNQLLRDSDWASMGHSIELRTPLIDIELLKNLAPYMDQFGKKPSKYYIKNALKNMVQKKIWDKKKTGFFIPVVEWTEDFRKSNQAYSEYIFEKWSSSL